ncbi:MAG: BamA/TamA family outer membrane protein [Candidatus Omnitrophica bacterium]|nr:BamA/TamA family outer membrane protein [Candidatus Omnitrophota bacterium]
MKKINFLFVILTVIGLLFVNTEAYAQVDASQTAGGVVQQETLREKSLSLKKRLEQKKESMEEVVSDDVVLDESGAKVMVNSIVVEGATLIPESVISGITSKYEGKEASLRGMQKVADLITDEYRAKGYATSRAYIPPQTMKDGVLIIRVVEGKLGGFQFRGNRYFKTALLEKKMDLQANGYFDYSALQRSMVYINEAPDRTARAVLVPGKEPGTTDIIIDVEDNYPFHASLEYDNYGSRFIDNIRYSVVLEHNNLLGFDDKAYAKVQDSESLGLQSVIGRYIFPLSQTLDIGAYYVFSRTRLLEDLKAIGAGGKAQIAGIFANKTLISKDEIDLRLNLGFDYKKVLNELASIQSSRDELRVFKVGFDLDTIDRWGRNVLTSEVDIGVPEIMNGMDAKDATSSRVGAGAKFQKYVFNYYRLQPMPFNSSLLLKNSAQYTNHNLTATEQFQIGGASSVRGYPAAENSGDRGVYSSAELSFPIYGLSKYAKVPLREERLYDALRLVCFYDFGFVHTKTLAAGEIENQTLKAWGVGARLNVSDDLAVRVEVGYPLGKNPSDGDNAHPWIEFVLKF